MGIMKTLTINGVTYNVVPVVPASSVTLLASAWKADGDAYSQIVEIPGVTVSTKVDLQPTSEQLAEFHHKVLAFVAENEGGIVTVYAIGDKPTGDHTIQVTLTEVDGTGKIRGNTVGTTMPRPDWNQTDPSKADFIENKPDITPQGIGARPNTWTPTASQVGAVPTSRKVNGKALSSDISLSATDVGARPSTWMPTASDVGAAPSGFGLGTGGKYVPSGNADSIFDGGFWRWDVGNTAQTPFHNATMLVVPRDKNATATQIAFCNANTGKDSIAFRTTTSTTPGEWMFVNPYLSVGNEYLTVERWKGKSVYKKLVSFGTLPATGEKNVNTSIAFSDYEIVGYSMQLLHSGGEYVYFMTPNLTFGFYKSGDNWHATAEAHSDLSAYTVTVEISYVRKG